MKKVPLHKDNDTWFCALVAVRYCIGRSSYAPSLVQDWIKRHWDLMPSQSKAMLLRDVSEAVADADRQKITLGDTWDHTGWVEFMRWLKETIRKEGIK